MQHLNSYAWWMVAKYTYNNKIIYKCLFNVCVLYAKWLILLP